MKCWTKSKLWAGQTVFTSAAKPEPSGAGDVGPEPDIPPPLPPKSKPGLGTPPSRDIGYKVEPRLIAAPGWTRYLDPDTRWYKHHPEEGSRWCECRITCRVRTRLKRKKRAVSNPLPMESIPESEEIGLTPLSRGWHHYRRQFRRSPFLWARSQR